MFIQIEMMLAIKFLHYRCNVYRSVPHLLCYMLKQWCEERGCRGHSSHSCDERGAQPPTLSIVLEDKVYKNHYSVVRGCFRFEKPLRTRYFTRYRVLKLRCLLDYNIIFLCKYVNLASKFLILGFQCAKHWNLRNFVDKVLKIALDQNTFDTGIMKKIERVLALGLKRTFL